MQNSNTLYSKIRFKIALGILACYASVTPAHAIPSPELIIGSVSSLSQILAVGFAMVSGAVAAFGAKFGLKPKIGSAHSGLLVKSILVLVLILSGSVGYNIYQSGQVEAKEQLRLHQTLIRPAQFSGTKIKDENLKETSLAAQKKSGLGISTAMAETMLNTKENSKETLFLDVRERAEYQMGTVPGARHIRFPDIATAGLALADKKVVLLCHNGNRSSETCERLAAMGIDCSFIAGGLEKWIVEGRSFTDASVRGLSDLRAVPAFKNKDELIGTEQFTALLAADDIQIVDTRYPKDFASGHLPNAINIPLRALPTIELEKMLSGLEKKPTVVACYDRRSCFMGQVLGLEMSQRGIDFLGRYTTPWDYFTAPPTKPHIQAWLSGQNKTLWGRAIDLLSGWLLLAAEKSHFLIGVLGLSLLSRLMILPIALKSEKDQIAVAAHKDALASLKKRLKHDPTRRARAVQAVHNEMGLTPLRNMTALLFLPVMMLGLSAIEQAAPLAGDRFLWIGDLGNIDPAYLFPMSFTILAGLYLQMTLARTVKQRMLSWGLAVPLLFAMVFKLTAAGTIYLNISLVLLLLQRAYVAGGMTQLKFKLRHIWRKWQVRVIFQGIVPLHYADLLKSSGNKAYRLAVMSTAGFSVPIGVVAGNAILQDYPQMSEVERRRFFDRLWHMVGQKTCVVRSSGADEEGADQSFAGVFDSVLDVDRAGLQGAFETVLKSFQSARAGFYQGGGSTAHRGNILIQQMVDAAYAGVLFTQDPMAPGQMLLELATGTADDLVSGRVTPLSLRFGKFTNEKCDEATAPIDLAALLAVGRDIEQLFGCPQDIEWTYLEGAFSVVQSRDITTLNLGTDTELARQAEWGRIFAGFDNSTLNGPILQQDEMSEVLPRPTPLSFAIMSALWAPGGSVDQACRLLGLRYRMPEAENGHLVRLFGKVYAYTAMKSQAALHLPKSVERNLEKRCDQVEKMFHKEFLPGLHKEITHWQAVDFSKHNLENQLALVDRLTCYFVDEVYVVPEQINILASFLNLKAEAACARQGLDVLQALHCDMPHAPSHMIAKAADMPDAQRKPYLLQTMGHRALFDYELSMPRYAEAPEMLWKLAKTSVLPSHPANDTGADKRVDDLPDVVALALQFQDLKEYAKHESLRIFAVLRRALLAVDHHFGDKGLVFYLTHAELSECCESNLAELRARAQGRVDVEEATKQFAPRSASLTLHECELSSSLAPQAAQQTGDLRGICVSGDQDVIGSVYIAPEIYAPGVEELTDFVAGDILVCKMMNPTWLPYVLQSKAVICEVGGWLPAKKSHGWKTMTFLSLKNWARCASWLKHLIFCTALAWCYWASNHIMREHGKGCYPAH